MKKTTILAVIVLGIINGSYSQSISEIGIWNNNANFTIEYYQDRVITSTTSGIQFMDVSNPATPSPAAALGNPAFFPMAIEINNDYAYFGGGMTGYFMIADISSINTPFQTGITLNINGTAYDIAIKDNYAFMSTNSDTLYAIDITDKTAPVVVNKLDLNSFPIGIAVDGNFAFIGCSSGLKIIDISDPSNMNITGSFGGGYEYISADPINNRLFVSRTGAGFDVIDISDPINPFLLFQGNAASSSGQLVFKNNIVFQLGGGVNAFEISQNSATYLCSYNSTFSGQVNSVTSKDSVFYVSTVNALHVLELISINLGINEIQKSLEISLFPNPTHGSITLSSLNGFDFSRISIHDLSGKLLFKDNFSARKFAKIDVSHLPKGMYFLKASNNYEEKQIKFIKD